MLKTMLLTKLKIALAVLLVAGIVGGGVLTLAPLTPAAGQTDAKQAAKPEPAAKKPDKPQEKKAVSWKERLVSDLSCY